MTDHPIASTAPSPQGIAPSEFQLAARPACPVGAEEMNRCAEIEAMGVFMLGMVHDLNNLLQVIHGYAQLAASATDPAASRVDLNTVVLAAEDATAITRMLVSLRHRGEMRRQPVDLAALLREQCRVMARLLGSRIRVVLNCARSAPHVLADPALLRCALLNLCLNARDAMPEGGTLTLSLDSPDGNTACRGAATYPVPGPCVRLTVADTGIGMGADVLERLFTPFFTTKGAGSGTGLGLFMVRTLVERHGGAVDVESAPGRGSAFSIYLPLTQDPGMPE